MFGMACGRNATKSKKRRPGTLERSTTQEKAMAQASVRVGTSSIRRNVLRRPNVAMCQGMFSKFAHDIALKAAADGSWKYGSAAAQMTIRSGSSLDSRK